MDGDLSICPSVARPGSCIDFIGTHSDGSGQTVATWIDPGIQVAPGNFLQRSWVELPKKDRVCSFCNLKWWIEIVFVPRNKGTPQPKTIDPASFWGQLVASGDLNHSVAIPAATDLHQWDFHIKSI